MPQIVGGTTTFYSAFSDYRPSVPTYATKEPTVNRFKAMKIQRIGLLGSREFNEEIREKFASETANFQVVAVEDSSGTTCRECCLVVIQQEAATEEQLERVRKLEEMPVLLFGQASRGPLPLKWHVLEDEPTLRNAVVALVSTALRFSTPQDCDGQRGLSAAKELALNRIQEGVLISDPNLPDNPIVYCNQAFSKISGYEVNEVVGRNCRFMHREDREQEGIDQIRNAVRDKVPVSTLLRNYRKDGTLWSNHVSVIPVFDEDNVLQNFVGIQNDVSQNIQIEKELAASEKNVRQASEDARSLADRQKEELFETVFVRAAIGVALIDWKSAKYMRANHKFCEIVGYSQKELQNRTWQSITHPEDLPQDLKNFAMLESREILECKLSKRYVRKDGQTVWVTISVAPVWEGGSLPASEIIVVEDITERKQAEEKLRKMEAELAHINRVNTMGEMATSMAHEVNQPLAAIANYAGTCSGLIVRNALDDEKATQAFAQIYKQARRAGDIVNRIKRFGMRHESERLPINVNRLVRDVYRLMEFQCSRARTTISLSLDESLPFVHADAIQLQQVLVNLVQNGLDSMAETAADSRLIAVVTRLIDDKNVQITVSDRGNGISSTVEKSMFEPYTTTKSSGLGLGLRITRRIVESHHGTISAFSNRDGIGASFRIVIPIEKPQFA